MRLHSGTVARLRLSGLLLASGTVAFLSLLGLLSASSTALVVHDSGFRTIRKNDEIEGFRRIATKEILKFVVPRVGWGGGGVGWGGVGWGGVGCCGVGWGGVG